MGNFLRYVRARPHLRALIARKSCAVEKRSAILRNHLIDSLFIKGTFETSCIDHYFKHFSYR